MIKPLLALLLTASLWASAAWSAGHQFSGSPEGMVFPPELAEKLDLSEQQKQDFLALMELYGPRFKQIAERGKADRQTLANLAPDDAAYSELSARVSQEAGLAAAEVVTLMAELQSNVYALLSEDQQAKFMQLRAEHRQRMEEKRDSWREGEKMHGDGHHCPHHDEHHAESDSTG